MLKRHPNNLALSKYALLHEILKPQILSLSLSHKSESHCTKL